MYYNFSCSMLHNCTSIQIATVELSRAERGRFIPIGIPCCQLRDTVQASNWRVVRDGGKVTDHSCVAGIADSSSTKRSQLFIRVQNVDSERSGGLLRRTLS